MTQNLLKHLAIIMDGNRRWAKENRVEKLLGHKAGLENIQQIIECCIQYDIKYLTLFAFSVENNNRSHDEVKSLFELLNFAISNYKKFLIENFISLKFIGDLSIIDENTKKASDELIKQTDFKNPTFSLIIAFNYSGRNEIVETIKKIILQNISQDNIDEILINQNLYTSEIPEPDLLIRTGGEMRLSNFMLWQLAYTELHFTKTNWPDFKAKELEVIFDEFNTRKRNFGK